MRFPFLPVLAQTEGGQSTSPMFMVVWIGIMILIFYVLIIRPQKRREGERQAMLRNVKTGDRVVFAGGLLGIIANVKDKTFVIRVADNLKVETTKGSVVQVLGKGEEPSESETPAAR